MVLKQSIFEFLLVFLEIMHKNDKRQVDATKVLVLFEYQTEYIRHDTIHMQPHLYRHQTNQPCFLALSCVMSAKQGSYSYHVTWYDPSSV